MSSQIDDGRPPELAQIRHIDGRPSPVRAVRQDPERPGQFQIIDEFSVAGDYPSIYELSIWTETNEELIRVLRATANWLETAGRPPSDAPALSKNYWKEKVKENG